MVLDWRIGFVSIHPLGLGKFQASIEVFAIFAKFGKKSGAIGIVLRAVFIMLSFIFISKFFLDMG